MTDRRSRLDEAIDRAVREMTHHDARPGFRRRVLKAIDAPARRTALFARLAFSGAVLAALVLTALFVRGNRQPDPAPQLVSSAPASAPVQPASQAPAAPQPAAEVPAPAPAPDTRRRVPDAPRPAAAPKPAPVFGPQPGRVAAASLLEEPAAAPPAIVAPPLRPRPVDLSKIVNVPLLIPRQPQR
jgi:hypothetical protein